jgi:hypothetical protein
MGFVLLTCSGDDLLLSALCCVQLTHNLELLVFSVISFSHSVRSENTFIVDSFNT